MDYDTSDGFHSSTVQFAQVPTSLRLGLMAYRHTAASDCVAASDSTLADSPDAAKGPINSIQRTEQRCSGFPSSEHHPLHSGVPRHDVYDAVQVLQVT